MLLTHDPNALQRLSAEARRWLWVIVAVLCVVGGGLCVWQNVVQRQREAAWEAREQNRHKLQAQKRAQIKALCNSRTWPDVMTKSELEAAINEGKPLKALPNAKNGQQQALWVDPISGQQAELAFEDGKWVGYHMSGPWAVAADPRPRPSGMLVETERVRRTVAGWNSGIAPMVWIALMVTAAVWRKKRPAILEVALGVAVVAGVAWLVNPLYIRRLSDIFSNDMLFWATLMLIITSIALWRAMRVRDEGMSGPPLCSNCQYNLTGNVSGVCPECGTAIPGEQVVERGGV